MQGANRPRVWVIFRGARPGIALDASGLDPRYGNLEVRAGRVADHSSVSWDNVRADASYELMWNVSTRSEAEALAALLRAEPNVEVRIQG